MSVRASIIAASAPPAMNQSSTDLGEPERVGLAAWVMIQDGYAVAGAWSSHENDWDLYRRHAA
jgi:hypothetical protein